MASKRTTPNVAQMIAAAIKSSARPAEPWCEGMISTSGTGIEIRDFGPIRLPMRAADVRKLVDVATQAPYGKGTKTIVDTSVRDTLEIDAANLTLSPELVEAVESSRNNIAEKLQLDQERLEFELYKLLIYPKGGFFLPHRDSEKRKGMVATMVVVMPSKFGGGELVIRHGGRQPSFSFPEAKSQTQPQYVAFFADCQHEVKKVTSGVRVCLAFNLILKPEPKSQQSKSASAVDPALEKQVANWFRIRPADSLVFAMDHQYTAAGLKPSHLKGTDRELYQNVVAIADEQNYQLHFGQVERHLCQFADDGSFGYGRRSSRRWSGDYRDLDIGGVFEDQIVVDGWKTNDGKNVALPPLRCRSNQLVSLVPCEDWIPTRQDYEGYTGNAGNTLDRWYHKSVITIWPKAQHFEIVTQMGLEFAISEWLAMRADLSNCTDEELEQACEDCQQLAEAIIKYWPNRSYSQGRLEKDSDPWLKQFADELPKFGDPDLIGTFLQVVSARDWQVNLDQLVLASLRQLGTEEILPALQQLLQFEPPANQYGVKFLEGLAVRDAKWLLKLARDKKHGGLSAEQFDSLFGIACEKLAAYVQMMAEKSFRRGTPPQESWRVLCQAMIAAESDRLVDLLQLPQDYPGVFEFREIQVPAAVKLRNFAIKRHGDVPNALRNWIDELINRLVQATAEEPSPPSDFRRPSETGCNCSYCDQLSRFLSDPEQEQAQIRAAEGARHHLEQVIRSENIDVVTKVIKSGSPYSLGLTKTTASYEADVKRFHKDLKLLNGLR
ncbi:MAG: 2OG-Fe(II) oxygenase [Planctomycetales bacterium]|nr:2OG-Fe(II) oxygenase [Planctomycetales bacterium]